jgi:hypothetical protein
VELYDPLTFPQYLAWREAVDIAEPLRASNYTAYCQALLPGVCACVAKWELVNRLTGASLGALTPANFPATPRKSADELLGWLVRGIGSLVAEADETDPK